MTITGWVAKKLKKLNFYIRDEIIKKDIYTAIVQRKAHFYVFPSAQSIAIKTLFINAPFKNLNLLKYILSIHSPCLFFTWCAFPMNGKICSAFDLL